MPVPPVTSAVVPRSPELEQVGDPIDALQLAVDPVEVLAAVDPELEGEGDVPAVAAVALHHHDVSVAERRQHLLDRVAKPVARTDHLEQMRGGKLDQLVETRSPRQLGQPRRLPLVLGLGLGVLGFSQSALLQLA